MTWLEARLWMPADARCALVRDGDGLVCVLPDGTRRWGVTAPGLRDAALVGDELWTCERGGVLRRRALADGLVVGELRDARVDGAGHFATSAFAPGVLVWNGGQRLRIAGGDGGGVTAREVPGSTDFALPITSDQLLHLHRGVIELRAGGDGGGAATWVRRLADSAVAIAHAGVLYNGSLIALLVHASDDIYQLVTLAAHDGAVLAQIALRGVTGIAFAPHRGHVVLLSRKDQVAQIDLREGEIVRDVVVPGGLDAVAVDGAAARVVIARGGRVQWRTPETIAAPAPGAAAPAPRPARPVNAMAPPTAAAPPPAPEPATEELPTGPFFALAVAAPPESTTPTESTAILDAHVRTVGARALCAVALGWDSGRLSLPLPDQLPFASELHGLLGIGRGRAPGEVAQADEHLRQAETSYRALVAGVGTRRWPLAIARREFGLSPLAAEILMIAAAPVLQGELARVYAILTNDPGRPLCDELLVCQILAGTPREQIALELDRDRPLRRHGLLLEPQGGERPFQPLRVDPLVVRLLRGLPLDQDLDSLEPYTATRTLTELRLPVGPLAGARQALEAPHDPAHPLRLVVRGRVGTGRRSLVAALAATCGRRLAVIDASLFTGPGRLEAVRITLRRAALRGLVPLVDGLDEMAEEDRQSLRAVRDVFAGHPGPLALRLGWDTTPPLAPGYVQIDLPTASESDRLATLTEALATHHLEARGATELASRYRVGPGVLERVTANVARTRKIAAASSGAPTTAASADATAELGEALRQHITTRLGATATRVKRLAGWPDIVLPDDVLDSLKEFVSRVRHRRTVYERWGYDKKLTSARGVTALFSGSPGTGKTLVASAIAKDLGLDLYRVDLARVVSKWIGETERNLAAVFDAAEDGQAVVLFDEADSLFTKRTEVKSSVDRYANLEVNYLLQRLDTFEGIAILTTNFGSGIDGAFKRRLSFRLTFPFPDEEMRERLWRIHVPPEVPRGGDLDFVELAERYRLSGGYIRNAAVRAAFLAASEGASLTQSHLERAVALEYREIGKLAESGTLE
jgi:ATPase family associated with various cellular activities (AAA)/Winged helix domain, variant